MGHRIAKHTYNSEDTWLKSTYYVLDAQGKSQLWLVKTQRRQALVRKLQGTMATYEHVVDPEKQTITFAQTEKHIFGSSRLGMHTEKVPMYGSQNSTYSMRSVTHHIGERTYELVNHLGNVLSVISDKVIPQEDAGGGTVTLFNDEFTNAGVSLGWYYEQSATGNPPTAGYSLTFTGGEMVLTAGAPFENAVKTVTIPNGANYTVSFDITQLSPVEDFYFITHDIVQLISSTGSYSFNGVGQSGPDMMGFLLGPGTTIHVDNVKVTYVAPASQIYLADIRHAQDYSPFGVTLHGRDLSLSTTGNKPYRYGYQGSEMDNEVKDGGNSYTTEFRQLDPRLGRWLTIDPHVGNYPMFSAYQVSNNNPICFIDIDGKDGEPKNKYQENFLKGKNLLFPENGAGLEFGGPYSNKEQNRLFNAIFFDQISHQESDGSYQTIVKLKPGVKASDAIRDIFANPGNYAFDCAETGQLMHLYALLETMGDDEKFNKYMNGFGIKQIDTKGVFTNDFTTLKNGKWIDRNNNPVPADFSIETKLKEDPIGTRYAILNQNAPEGTAFQFENFYKVGDDQYAANPMGGVLSLQQLKEELAGYTYEKFKRKGETLTEYANRTIVIVERETYVEYENPKGK